MSQIFLLTYITTFEPETPAGHLKYQKTRNVAWFPVKTLAKYYHLTVGAQGQAKWAKVAKKSSTYDVTHKKPASTKQKIFFRVQTKRLATSFETFTGSVENTGPEKFPREATCV